MNRKVWIVLVFFASLGLTTFSVWSMPRPHHCINRDGFERLRVGMTEKEVESVLGRPAGDYSTGFAFSHFGYHGPPRDWMWIEPKHWISNDGAIAVYFDAGCVVHTDYSDVFCIEESMLDKLRRWLSL